MQPDDTDHVRWFLNINNERAYVSDRIYIKDQIQPGQTLDKSSFNITVDGYNNFYGSDAIEKFELAYPGSSISINESTGEITVIIPQDQAQLNSFSILYLTSVDDYNQPTFKNDSQAWYTENNQPAVYAQESDSSVSNVNANGGVDGKNQTKVSVIKEWADNNNSARLRPDSIKVQLYANGLLTGKAVTLNSANNWQYTWSGLVKNAKGSTVTYTVKEVSIPAGYTSTVDGYNITNTHKPTTPKPQVPNKPTTPKEPQVPNNGNKVTPKAYTQGKTYEKTGKLPQTGDESSMGMMLIGLVTLLLSLGLVVISRFTI
ncbi:Collagen adhesin [Lactobacillus helveticus]|uniref:Cna B-type domain-containing protein n=1 Tax=Lactobacillus helveticus TaxID=1587 RepID=UPI001564979F|nr:Cna B-type domain-containing protein [Lactobacillus helveticus]NRN87751.1 Collagen adhesin [Lactobacillus helveticus]